MTLSLRRKIGGVTVCGGCAAPGAARPAAKTPLGPGGAYPACPFVNKERADMANERSGAQAVGEALGVAPGAGSRALADRGAARPVGPDPASTA